MATRRRGHGEGEIRQRTDGRWEARFYLPNGDRKSQYGKTRREVQEKLRDALRSLDQGVDLGAPQQKVADFLDTWLEDIARPRIRPSTYKSYALNIRLHLKPGLGHYRLDKLSARHIQSFLTSKHQSGLSPKTVSYVRVSSEQRWLKRSAGGWSRSTWQRSSIRPDSNSTKSNRSPSHRPGTSSPRVTAG